MIESEGSFELKIVFPLFWEEENFTVNKHLTDRSVVRHLIHTSLGFTRLL
ncbi:MAG: hypothetical protein ACRCZW_13340 [Lactobacillaceae bacterium]